MDVAAKGSDEPGQGKPTPGVRYDGSMPARPTLYLHIGTSKTGTSSVQHFFARHRRRLALRGILYPNIVPTTKGHHALPGIYAKQAYQWTESRTLEEFLGELRRQMDDTANLRGVLLSSEGFWGIPRHVQRLADDLSGFDVRVMVYLRRQDDYIESRYRQTAKMHLDIADAATFLEGKLGVLDYLERLTPWADVFGADNVSVRPYEPRRWDEPIEYQMLRWVGLDPQAGQPLPIDTATNPSLNTLCLRYLRTLATATGIALNDRRLRPLHEVLGQLTRDMARSVPDRLFYGADLRAVILDRFDEGNRTIAQRFLGSEQLFDSAQPPTGPAADLFMPLSPAEREQVDHHLAEAGLDAFRLSAASG